MTDKTVNYTDEMVARMREVYNPEATQDERDAQVKQLAEELGRSTRSIISKLSREKLYVAKEYRTKQGNKPVSKAALVSGIAALLETDEDVVGSLEKATKTALVRVFSALREAREV